MCICNPTTQYEEWLLEHCGCPEEICPGCCLTKRHDSPLCFNCALFNRSTRAYRVYAFLRRLHGAVSVRLAQPRSGRRA